MRGTLGAGIGTSNSNGVRVAEDGAVVHAAVRAHDVSRLLQGVPCRSVAWARRIGVAILWRPVHRVRSIPSDHPERRGARPAA